MKQLVRRKSITGIELIWRLDNIVQTLFAPAQPGNSHPVVVSGSSIFADITEEELRATAKTLPNEKTPGLDSIHNEIFKAAALSDPRRFTALYNACILLSL